MALGAQGGPGQAAGAGAGLGAGGGGGTSGQGAGGPVHGFVSGAAGGTHQSEYIDESSLPIFTFNKY